MSLPERRSSRQRLRPLAFWENERVVYERSHEGPVLVGVLTQDPRGEDGLRSPYDKNAPREGEQRAAETVGSAAGARGGFGSTPKRAGGTPSSTVSSSKQDLRSATSERSQHGDAGRSVRAPSRATEQKPTNGGGEEDGTGAPHLQEKAQKGHGRSALKRRGVGDDCSFADSGTGLRGSTPALDEASEVESGSGMEAVPSGRKATHRGRVHQDLRSGGIWREHRGREQSRLRGEGPVRTTQRDGRCGRAALVEDGDERDNGGVDVADGDADGGGGGDGGVGDDGDGGAQLPKTKTKRPKSALKAVEQAACESTSSAAGRHASAASRAQEYKVPTRELAAARAAAAASYAGRVSSEPRVLGEASGALDPARPATGGAAAAEQAGIGSIRRIVSSRRWGRGWQYFVQREGGADGDVTCVGAKDIPAEMLEHYLRSQTGAAELAGDGAKAGAAHPHDTSL